MRACNRPCFAPRLSAFRTDFVQLIETRSLLCSCSVVRCRVLFERGELRACDFVGAFILAFVAMRHHKWTMGPLHPAIGAAVCNDTSARIGLIPGLANLLRHELERVWPSTRGATAVGAIDDISLEQVR